MHLWTAIPPLGLNRVLTHTVLTDGVHVHLHNLLFRPRDDHTLSADRPCLIVQRGLDASRKAFVRYQHSQQECGRKSGVLFVQSVTFG